MRRKHLLPAAVFAISVCTSAAATADVLRIGGTGGALGAMSLIAAPFAAATGIDLEILPSLGSSGSLRAVGDGAIDAALSARAIEPAEAKSGVVVVPYARTALVFVTSHPKPNGWNAADIARIFNGGVKSWNDGTPINVILRTKLDTDSQIVSETFPGAREAINQARRRPDLPVSSTDQDNAELAETLTGSFVQAGLSQIESEKRKLRLVAIDGVEPSLANLESGTYRYEKPFYLVSKPGNFKAEALAKFLRSEKGRELLRETGNLPVSE